MFFTICNTSDRSMDSQKKAYIITSDADHSAIFCYQLTSATQPGGCCCKSSGASWSRCGLAHRTDPN